MNLRTFRNIFLTGLATLLPVVLTIYLFYWAITTTERFLASQIRMVLPPSAYIPGMGLVAAILAIFLIGLLMRALYVRRVFGFWEGIIHRIPLINTVYGAIRDFSRFIAEDRKQKFSRVVLVEMPNTGMRLLGFVTREDFSQLNDLDHADDTIAVYLPMSYQIGGYTVFMSKAACTQVNMSMEDALRFAVTAGMSGVRKD